jgi:hypothetical protein
MSTIDPARQPGSGAPDIHTHRILAGQKALVTGANSGIGRGVALALGAAGADVAVNYVVGDDTAKAVVDEIKSFGVNAMAYKADVSSEDQVAAMFKAVIQAFGTLDILVNNAGLQRDSAFQSMTLAEWNTVISINLTGQFLCAREAIREFLRRGVVPAVSCAAGKIICMGRPRELCELQRRHQDVDGKPRSGSGAAAHTREWHCAGRDTHADQYVGVVHARGLCRSHETGALRPHR